MTTNMAARVSVSFVRRLGCFRNLSPICRPAEVKARSMVDLYKTKTVGDSFQRINCRSLSLNPEPDSFTSSTSSSSSSTTSRDGLQLSDSCVKQLKKVIGDAKDSFLRVLVEGGGCAGFQYKFELDVTLDEEDRVFEKDGVKVVVDEASLEYIKGSMIDYHREMIRSSFQVINNPKAETGCSCGASFSLKL